LIYFLWDLGQYKNEEMSQLFGITYSAVSHCLQKTAQTREHDAGLKRKLDKLINSLIIKTTSIRKIPPNLPLQREEFPLFGKEGRGEIFRCLCQFNFETLNNSLSRQKEENQRGSIRIGLIRAPVREPPLIPLQFLQVCPIKNIR